VPPSLLTALSLPVARTTGRLMVLALSGPPSHLARMTIVPVGLATMILAGAAMVCRMCRCVSRRGSSS
jgi:hypothetical protein